MQHQYYVYILASKKNGTLYTGVTSDLVGRVFKHKKKYLTGFSSRHNVNKLVYYEIHTDIEQAIIREKQIKAWKRKWKLNLIERNNLNWDDLYDDLF
jgi:putative endonuclease